MTEPFDVFRQALAEHSVPLSEPGIARRDGLRATLTGMLVRRRRVRRTLRVVALAVLGAVGLRFWPQGAPVPAIAPAPSSILIVHDDPTLLSTWRAEPARDFRIERVDDERALELLAASDQPGGFIRIAGKVLVAPHDPAQPE